MKTQISFLLKTTDFWPIVLAGSLVMAMISGIYAQNGGPGGPPPDEQGGPNGDGPGAPPEGGPGGPGGFGGPGGADGPGGGPGGHSKTCVLNGVYLVDGKTVQTENEHYVSATNDWSAIYVKNGGALTLVNPTITTTGNTSSQDNSSFYGLNAGILATKNSKIIMIGGSISTTGSGANGAFAYGPGSEVRLTKMTINATGDGGHGVMTSGGGSLYLEDVDITTTRAHAAPIATDRGGGTVTVVRGNVRSTGEASPGLYSTGTLIVSNAMIDGAGAEAAVIEGQNSITVIDSTLKAGQRRGVMLYQSFSGDAEGRESHFTMRGGSLSAAEGPLFFVTNAKGIIDLNAVAVSVTSGVLVKAAADHWGRQNSNGGTAVLSGSSQTLKGDLIADKISSITVTLTNNSSLSGKIEGSVVLTLDATSQWNVSADSTLSSLTDSDATLTNIHDNGHDIRYDASLPSNSWLDGKSKTLAGGGHLIPATK
mgnify:CR=1 FL=1